MKPWKSLAIASAVMAFTVTAQAECLGVDHATQTVANETATGTVTTNRRALNRLAANRLAANRLAANRLAANRLAANRLAANRLAANQPGEGAASDIIAIEMPDGTRLSR
jgi:hypothetical protein